MFSFRSKCSWYQEARRNPMDGSKFQTSLILLDIWGWHKKGTSLLIELIVVALEHGLQWQRWRDSLFLQITIHLYSQADSDDSIQLNPSFSGSSKETQFPIPNYISIEVNDSSMILSELWQNEADSTHSYTLFPFHSFMRFFCKMLQIHPLCTFAWSPPNLLS